MKGTEQPRDSVAKREIEVLRRMGPAGRLEVAFGLYEFSRERLTAFFEAEHPEWTESQVRAAVRERLMMIR